MTTQDVVKWNKRASMLYAFGVWTMIGAYAFFRYMGYYEVKPDSVKKVEREPDPNEVVYQTAYTKTTITYKKDFVPYPTRIYNFFSSGSETGGNEK